MGLKAGNVRISYVVPTRLAERVRKKASDSRCYPSAIVALALEQYFGKLAEARVAKRKGNAS